MEKTSLLKPGVLAMTSQLLPKIIVYQALPDVAWKNGRGLTRELLVYPFPRSSAAGASSSKEPSWRIRLSVARIKEDCEFSNFENTKRIFAVLEGNGVRLHVDQSSYEVRPNAETVVFSGSAHTSCQILAGKTLDLNLMLRGEDGFMEFLNGSTDADLSLNSLSSILGRESTPLKHMALFSVSDGLVIEESPKNPSSAPEDRGAYDQKTRSQRWVLEKYSLAWFEKPPPYIYVRGKSWFIGIYENTKNTRSA